jgi:beta-galactosidase/beta-glucuronidase
MNARLSLLSILLSLAVVSLTAQVSFGTPEKINDNWKFILNDVKDGQQLALDDQNWQQLDLPHDWSVKGQLSQRLFSGTGYLPGGIGWYRKTLRIPQEKQGEKVYLYFEGVYNRSEVFVNGQSLGTRPYGYISFMYDATPHIEYGKDNVIAVRVDHSRSADSRWYTGSGIYRDVWLVYANPVHIAQWGVFAYPVVNRNEGTLHIETEIENGTAQNTQLVVMHELFSPEGRTVARASRRISVSARQKGTVTSALKVNRPKLWSL